MGNPEARVLISGAYQVPRETYSKGLRQLGFQTSEITENHQYRPRKLREILKHHDALLIQGGADIHPKRYGEEKSQQTTGTNEARDQLEDQLITQALEEGKPIVGICRGAQFIGIKLAQLHPSVIKNEQIIIQDIPSMITTDIYHGQPRSYDLLHENRHPIEIFPNTLANYMYGNTINMTTAHHQALNGDILARIPNVTLSAITADAIPEIFEMNSQFVVGTQGHPEVAEDIYTPLFREFHEAALAFKANNTERVIFDMSAHIKELVP